MINEINIFMFLEILSFQVSASFFPHFSMDFIDL